MLYVGLAIGIFVGMFIGIVIAALCHAAHEPDMPLED